MSKEKCERCGGDGKEIEGDDAGVMVETGRPCPACDGAGERPRASAPPSEPRCEHGQRECSICDIRDLRVPAPRETEEEK